MLRMVAAHLEMSDRNHIVLKECYCMLLNENRALCQNKKTDVSAKKENKKFTVSF